MKGKKEVKEVKKLTSKRNFYLPQIISCLSISTNLSNIQKKLNISKQKLNYYIGVLKKNGIIIQKGRGWYEVVKKSKNSTQYGSLLEPNSIRGHAYICDIKIVPQEIKDWTKRINILEKNGVNFKLVGSLKNIPRIKVLGRKVWLCNNKIRIFDKKDASYYGKNAKESRNMALNEIKLIVGILERKLGIFIKPEQISLQREHYALIKNELAIEENRRGNLIHISDENGEWLLIDDSLGEGGELENIGKRAYHTNPKLQKWWNENKETNFEVTPKFILKVMNDIQQVQKVEVENKKEYAQDLVAHKEAIKQMGYNTEANTKSIELLASIIKELKDELINYGNK